MVERLDALRRVPKGDTGIKFVIGYRWHLSESYGGTLSGVDWLNQLWLTLDICHRLGNTQMTEDILQDFVVHRK